MPNKKLVLITGASGTLGPTVVKTVLEKGYRVRTLARNPIPKGFFPDEVESLTGDIVDANAVRLAMLNVNVVVHLAAMLHINTPTPAQRKLYKKINVGGTSTIVDAAVREGVKRIVYFSSVAVYGRSNGSVLNEASPTAPETEYARTKLAGEGLILGSKGEDGSAIGTVLRLGAVYGPRVNGNYQTMIRALAHGKFVPVGDGLNRRSMIYDQDAAAAATIAGLHPGAAGRIFNMTDGRVHTVKEIIFEICNALDRKPPRFFIPALPARIAAGLCEDCARFLGIHPPVTRAAIDKFAEDLAVEGKQIQKELGFVPKYTLNTGWREAIGSMRASGIL